MKNMRRTFEILLLLSFCAALLVLAGCGAADDFDPDGELTDENSMEVTIVNASGFAMDSISMWWGKHRDSVDPMRSLGRNVEPDEVITLRIPRAKDHLYDYKFWSVDQDESGYGRCVLWGSGCYIPEKGIIIVPPSDEYYDEIRTVYESDMDIETAKEETLSQYWAAYEAEQEEILAAEREAAAQAAAEAAEKAALEAALHMSQQELDEAVKELGYDSLAEMRTELNPDISFRDYDDDESAQAKQDGFDRIYGYWYPDGDRNSIEYFSLSERTFHWYRFVPGRGDVEMDSQQMKVRPGLSWSYWLGGKDGDVLTMKVDGVLQFLTSGTFYFDENNTTYCDSRGYTYSAY